MKSRFENDPPVYPFLRPLAFGPVLLAMLWALLPATSARAQEVMVDRLVRCGDMICFPSYEDEHLYYYLPDQPRLATKQGRPQFSFLKYARMQKTGKAGITRAEGGGILHFLVIYGPTKQRIARARAALKRMDKQARLAGPILYRKARFALVTTFNKENKTFTRVVTVGKAPVLEGQKAAVSIGLTREGAEVLWESFKTSTPDISLVFEMEYDGIRQPYEATLIGDWSKISSTHQVRVGGVYKWFGADIDMLFQKLRKEGAIQLIVKGKDKEMDAIWKSAQKELTTIMFKEIPLDTAVRQEVERGGYPNLDKAMQISGRGGRSSSAPAQTSSRQSALERPKEAPRAAIHFQDHPLLLLALKKLVEETLERTVTPVMASSSDQQKAAAAFAQCKRKADAARVAGYTPDTCRAACACLLHINPTNLSKTSRKERSALLRTLEQKCGASWRTGCVKKQPPGKDVGKTANRSGTGRPTSSGKRQPPQGKHTTSARRPSQGKNHHTPSGKGTSSAVKGSKGNDQKGGTKGKGGKGNNNNRGGGGKGVVGLLVSYRLRHLKSSGHFELSLKRYRVERQYFVMSENIGDLYDRYGQDPRIFRAVLIDDPVYKQREVLVTLDGQDAHSFERHVNFVTVQLRKKHQSGEISRDEIVITPETFNQRENRYEFIYGYKGDEDRDAWLEYEARDLWSLHGDILIEHPWQAHQEPVLNVASPVVYKRVVIEGSGRRLTTAGVRHGVITFHSSIAGQELEQEVSIRNRGPAPSAVIEIPVSRSAPRAEYEITWFLEDGRRVDSARQPLQGSILYWDLLPREE